MSTWYVKSIESADLQVEAGMKENLLIGVLALCISGDVAFLSNFISKRLGIDPAQFFQNAEILRPEAEEILKKSETIPEAMALVERAEELVAEAEQEVIVAQPKDDGSSISMKVVDAVVQIEGASPEYIGPAGDTGLMQILPDTWEEINSRYFNGQFPYDEYALNAHMSKVFGRKYLEHINSWLRKKDIPEDDLMFLTLAAYNGGMGNVQKCEFDPEVLRSRLPSVYDYARRAMNIAEI